jgi:hypothetical protein
MEHLRHVTPARDENDSAASVCLYSGAIGRIEVQISPTAPALNREAASPATNPKFG